MSLADCGPLEAVTDELPFRQLAKSLPTPCWISDPSGHIVWVNDAWIEYTGFDVDAIEREGLAPLHDRTVLPRVNARWDEVRKAGGAAEMVFPLRGRDGELRPFLTRVAPLRDKLGRTSGWFGTNTDISARAEAETRARRGDEARREDSSERQFRLLVANVVDYALYMLDPEGLVASWNAGAQAIKGYDAEEIVGQHFSRFYTEEDRAAGVPRRALATALEKGRFEAEGWRVRKDGSRFWASVVIDTICDEAGQHLGFAKITRDITERRAAQLDLQRAYERLAQAQKLEAVGQLTGGVAHDFNNLLMVVGGQAQLLRDKAGDDPTALRRLDAIDAAARRGQDLTRHLLAFARRQRLQPAPLRLDERAASLRELILTSVGSMIRVSLDLPPQVWPIQADAGELELALLNMSVNARDAMPHGGSLSISARNAMPEELAGLDLTGDFVVLTIVDTGQGIPPDILPKVFEPFFTTKPVNRGTGLGLSQVYGFASQSGGRATVESELGVGTRIRLLLPRAADEVCAAPARPQPAAPARGLEILVVEDNPEVSEVASGLLVQLGHSPRPVASADEAVTWLATHPLPDLVFSDIVMAGELDGLALAERLRAEHPGLPVLLASGYSHAAARSDLGFPILPKPYQIEDLAQAITAAACARDGADSLAG